MKRQRVKDKVGTRRRFFIRVRCCLDKIVSTPVGTYVFYRKRIDLPGGFSFEKMKFLDLKTYESHQEPFVTEKEFFMN